LRYRYETPRWVVVALSLLALVLGAGLFAVLFVWGEWDSADPLPVRLLLVAMAVVFTFAGLRPGNWRAWLYFYADETGLHFPSDCPLKSSSTWLHVPWERVGDAWATQFINRRKGIALALALDKTEIDRYFRNAQSTKRILGRIEPREGYFSVGYSNAFQRPGTVVRTLDRLKQGPR